ncbi:hypothetical protein M3_0128 [Lysinibacillus phage vB_LfM_LysYB1]|nr:hypothetical protein M3_0128 [Lysinibacillus phage vB_LfM_LysYB1]WAB25362.1 hypothetical protein M5_0184 [Lysinibacillus phage vB_LfM_LysYB2]
MSDNLSGWRKCVTHGMVGCKDCGKTISISKEKKLDDGRLVISETSRDERTYFQKGKKRLCVDCYGKLFGKPTLLGDWKDEGDKV